jgi:hypothetical protein
VPDGKDVLADTLRREDESFEPGADVDEHRRQRKRKRRIKPSELGKATAVASPEDWLLRLSLRWGTGDEASWKPIWEDIEYLADRFLAGAEELSPAVDSAWHHLLLAVGNFKRQAPITPTITLTPTAWAARPDRLNGFFIPGSGSWVQQEEPETWPHLTDGIKGLGVPTATTLLSALWPGSHMILDRRDIRAAVGIGPAKSWKGRELDDAWLPDLYDWEWYSWLRDSIFATEGLDAVMVERALYVLDRTTQSRLGDNWKWHEYSERADEVIAELE